MICTKEFDQELNFTTIGPMTPHGPEVKYALVDTKISMPGQNKTASFPLLFDTGASQVVLARPIGVMLGITKSGPGIPQYSNTANGVARGMLYEGVQIEVFGKKVLCPVVLLPTQFPSFYQGLLGRQALYQYFGFGFWEKESKLYISTKA